MSHATPLRRLATLALAVWGAACSSDDGPTPTLEIVSPKAGALFSVADDLLPEVPGVQIEAEVRTTQLDGLAVRLTVPGATGEAPGALAEGGVAKFPFTLSASGELVASATLNGTAYSSAPVAVTLDPAVSACRIVAPKDGATLTASDDQSPNAGFQVAAEVRCGGVELGNPVTLTVNGSPAGTGPLGPGGAFVLPAIELAEGENLLVASVKTNAGLEVTARATVTLASGGCRVLLAPPSGTVFNAAGAEGGVADAVPGGAIDAVLNVAVDAACEGGEVEIRQGDQALGKSNVAGGSVAVPVVLPDGPAVELRAHVTGTGTMRGLSAPVTYLVDSVVPAATLSRPSEGAVYTDADDVSTAPGLQLAVEGLFSGIAPSQPFDVVIDPGSASEQVVGGLLPANGAFSLAVTVLAGPHTLIVRTTRASGNSGTSAPVSFQVVTRETGLAIASPLEGESYAAARDADPATDGYQMPFQLTGAALAGRSGLLRCGDATAAFTLTEGGFAEGRLTFENLACGATEVTCIAEVVTAAGVRLESPAVHVVLDPIAPEVTLFTPLPNVAVSTPTVDFNFTTGCSGETQSAMVLGGGVMLAQLDAVTTNAFQLPGVPLAEGPNDLVLRVTDLGGNITDVPVSLVLDSQVPAPAILSPAADGVVLTASDDEQGTLEDGFQRTIVVEVPNEAAGTRVTLALSGRSPIEGVTSVDGAGALVATFPGFTLPEGEVRLTACAEDLAVNVGCVQRIFTVSTGRPTCLLDQPSDGTRLGNRDDLNVQLPGIQTAAVVRTNAPQGSTVTLELTGPDGTVSTDASATVDEFGAARFAALTLAAEGRYALTATCADVTATGRSLPNRIDVLLSAPALSFAEPLDGAVFNLTAVDRGVADGFQIDVSLSAAEDSPGAVAHLTVDCGQGPTALAPVPVDDQLAALFSGVTLADEAECALTTYLEDAVGNHSGPTTVHVTSDRVAPVLAVDAPADALVLGSGTDASLDDGFQLTSVLAQVSGAASVKLEVNGVEIAGGTFDGAAASWSLVTLADGANTLVVTATDAAGNEATEVRTLVVDPSVVGALLTPLDGATLTDNQDVSPDAGLQAEFAGHFDGLAEGAALELVLDAGTAAATIVPGVIDAVGNFSIVATLENGPHTATVRTAGPEPVQAVTTQTSFRSVYLDAALAITAPIAAGPMGRASDANAAEGLQIAFSIAGRNLGGVSGSLSCDAAAAVPFAFDGSGLASVEVTFANLPCEGVATNCVAHVETADGLVLDSAALALAVDDTAPAGTLLTPVSGSWVNTASVTVEGTADCAGEPQTALVLAGATEVARLVDVDGNPAFVTTNGFSLSGVALSSGQNDLVFRVIDAAGNFHDSAFSVGLDQEVPVVAFVTPDASVTIYRPEDDADGDLSNGLQHDLAVTVDNEISGTPVQLTIGTQAPLAGSTVSDGSSQLATFAAVTLSEGDLSLTACAADRAGNIGCASRPLRVATNRPTCDITSPLDGATLGRNDDTQEPSTTALIEKDVVVATNGSVVDVTLDGAPLSGAPYTAVLGEGVHTLQAHCISADGVTGASVPSTVTVTLTAPTLAFVDPLDGQVFNLASADRGVAAGFQTDIVLSASAPSNGAVVKLTSNCGSGPVSEPDVLLDGTGQATFAAVSLPDTGTCTFTAHLEDAYGNVSPQVSANVSVDRVAPVLTIAAPGNNTRLGSTRDATPATPEFDLGLVTAQVSGLGTGGITLTVGAGAPLPPTSTTTLPSGVLEARWQLVRLQEGANALVVTATDASGNAVTQTITVVVDTNGPVVNLPYNNNTVLTRASDRDTVAAGLQQNITLTGERLDNGTVVRVCSTVGSGGACQTGAGFIVGETTLGGGSAALNGVTLPEGTIDLYAEAIDPIGNVAQSSIVTLFVDSQPPVVTALTLSRVTSGVETPLDTQGGTATFGRAQDGSEQQADFQTRLSATVTGLQTINPPTALTNLKVQFIDTNPTPGFVLAEVPIAADGTVTADVTLREGGHRIHVLVRDNVGNFASTPDQPIAGFGSAVANFGVDLTPPTLTLLAPVPGKLLAAADLDPNTAGLQFDIDVTSNAGTGRVVELFLDGAAAAFATVTLPSGGRGQKLVTLPEGAHTVSASVTDVGGNTTTAGPVSIDVDSIAPVVVITQPSGGVTLSTDADPVADGFQIDAVVTWGQVEDGRTLLFTSSTGGTLATITTDASGTATLTGLTVPAGAQQLTATVSDLSGNETTSAPVSVTIDTGAPSIRFQNTANPLYLGTPDGFSGTNCTPTVIASSDTDGVVVELLADNVTVATGTISNGVASLTGLVLANNASTSLKLKATDAASRVAYTPVRPATCDLNPPTLSVTSPTGATLTYVANGNPGSVAGAISDKAPGAPLEADFTVVVTAAVDGKVTLTSSLDGVVATHDVTTTPETVSFSNVPFATKGTHTLTIRAATRSGTFQELTRTMNVDVEAPVAIHPTAALATGSRTTVQLTFTAPGDDGAAGGSVSSYVVKRADTDIVDESGWNLATAVPLSNVMVASPGGQQTLSLKNQPFDKNWFYAVRATDAAGNVSPLGTAGNKDLRLSRLTLTTPTANSFRVARLAMGDFDGDGSADFAASAGNFNTNVGRVDVYYGATNPGSAVTLPLPTGTAGTPRMGYTMTAGDVNGDGFSDLLVAAPTANTQGSTFKDGEVYIYLGQSGVRLTASSQPNVILKGRIASPDTTSTALGMGYFLAVADFNGDGINDIAASSPYENANKGYVRIFAGQSAGSWSPTGAQVVVQASSALATLTTTRTGVTSGPQLGWRIASPGDLDGDGKAELVASAPTGTLASAGPALRPIYVASGAMLSGAVTVENTAGVFYSVDAATSALTTSQFGYDLFAGDVTGDGVKDVVATDVDGRVVVMSGALLASFVPTAVGSVAPGLDASASARVGSVNSFASQSGGVPQLHWLGDVTGDGIDDFASFRSSPTTSTEIRIYYGRSASDWTSISVAAGGAQLTPAADALIARGTISDYAGLVGGHFLGGTLRDLVVLDIAGSAIVLSGP